MPASLEYMIYGTKGGSRKRYLLSDLSLRLYSESNKCLPLLNGGKSIVGEGPRSLVSGFANTKSDCSSWSQLALGKLSTVKGYTSLQQIKYH